MFDRQESAAGTAVQDYRLPENVTPQRYEIRLVPDLKAFKFDGEESVLVTVHEPTREVQLNALEIEIDRVSAERDAKKLSATVQLVPERERARFVFPEVLEAGTWTLRIAFRGILNDKLHGFYRSFYKDESGTSHTVASTQFEATDARRAFPCWDEPALKAKFKPTLVIDENLTAFSNTAIESEKRLGNGKKEVVFKETIKMSTYLVAFVVGDFEATKPVEVNGTPLRVVHVPGKQGLTHYAQEIGSYSLRFYEGYYGIKYPGGKLDLIAIPDFAAGAMENLGAITFRETALLIDENRASRAELERVADVVSHENAHMWFGDLVTMRWWNGIWLNEAFATFMEMLAVDSWKPQWRRWDSFALSRSHAMGVDGLNSTRPVEYAVRSPEDARSMFDTLTYEKGSSVLRMLEQYLHAEQFRKGISLYLKRHEYANTETGDLWDALQEASGEPVRKVMDSWIFQPGFPVVHAELSPDGRSLKLRQQRFLYLDRGEKKNAQLWHVPVLVRAKAERGASSHRILLSGEQAALALGGKTEWAVVNEGGHGFYRVRYSPEILAALTRNLKELKPVERFGLVSDTWAATVAAMTPLAEFLKMVRLFRGETDLNVWRAIIGALSYLDMVVVENDRAALAAEVRVTLAPAVARMGWEAKPGEDELSRQLRATLIGALGTLGDDPAVQNRARELYAQYEKKPDSVDRDLVPHLIGILAWSGDEARYKEFKNKFKTAKVPQEEQRYLYSLASFRRLPLLRETMQMTIDGEVRTQNAPYLMQSLLINTSCRDEAWEFMKHNWDTMVNRFPDAALPRMCEGIVALVNHEDDVRKFFAAHKVRIGEKLIDQHLERLSIAVAFRKREGTRMAATLKQ
jgi:puromycin-sensitive aminopeptidase